MAAFGNYFQSSFWCHENGGGPDKLTFGFAVFLIKTFWDRHFCLLLLYRFSGTVKLQFESLRICSHTIQFPVPGTVLVAQ